MKVLVSGSTGLIGSRLVDSLRGSKATVVRLVRPGTKAPPGERTIEWDVEQGRLDRESLASEGPFDAVVHLAGENIGSGRWSEAKKRAIRDSRVQGTRLLAEALASVEPPRVLVSGSAIGYYGDRGDELLTEASPPGEGFLPQVCKEWEAATAPLESGTTRVVHLRTGLVLSGSGGALPRMLLPFRLGVGGKVGSGRQHVSWITVDDIARVIEHAIAHEELRGPVNGVAPNPVTNAELTKALGRVLRRPTIFPAPAFALRLVLGEMADALLLSSARVAPGELERSGYRFQHPMLEEALRHVLGRG